MTEMLVVPVFPVASRTVPVNVWVPFDVAPTGFGHRILTGPSDDVVWLPICWPSAISVKTLDAPLVPSTRRTTHTVPLTVAPAFGSVMKTCNGLGGGGGGATCLTPTPMTCPLLCPPRWMSNWSASEPSDGVQPATILTREHHVHPRTGGRACRARAAIVSEGNWLQMRHWVNRI